ncbi:MAG: hypothetical protein GY799_28290, partial [Desulfobulbaceae bacterium]|nr:hypothetical protein [Desulfobulbaceae bacterium]
PAQSLTVTIVDDVPLAEDDIFNQTSQNAAVVFTAADLILDDEQGADGATVTDVTLTSANGGSLVEGPSGTWTYTPVAGEEADATFTYTITDGDGDTSTANGTIDLLDDIGISVRVNTDDGNVDESSLRPVPTGDATANGDFTFTGDPAATLSIDGVDIDLSVPGVTPAIAGSYGNLVVTVDGSGNASWEYTLTSVPDVDAVSVPDTFSVTVTDEDGDVSTPAQSLTVTIVDDVPLAEDDIFNQTSQNAAVVFTAADLILDDEQGAD